MKIFRPLFIQLILVHYFSYFLFSQDTSVCFLRDPGGRIREHNVDFIKMKLDVRFNVSEGKVFGNVKYDFRPIQYVVDTLFLNAPEIDIKRVLVDGMETPFSTDSNGVTIRFREAMDWNRDYKLEISYEATPRKGIYFIGWNVNDQNKSGDKYFTRKQIWTQGQGIDNRHWIPCYDDVNDKMLTETIITFDSSYHVISNGVLKSRKINADGTATWNYLMNKPMVPYLIMIAIDKYAYKDFKSKNGMVSRQFYYSDKPETVQPTYQYSAEMMDWLCHETGVFYPWENYCNVPVQDFMYGAMENTTATIYGDFYLCDARSSLERNYIATNAHELTHQWFGDYVTEYSAAHHWLHESFATYYAKHFIHKVFGEDRYEWDRRGEQNSAVAADKNDRYAVGHSKGGSPRVYPKGSAVLDMLRYVVGDSVYKRSVTNYLKQHAYGNVLNEDFKMAFMETGGINLYWFFEQWIYRSGFPQYEINYEKQDNRVAFYVSQNQQVDELTSYFRMPVYFEVHFKDSSFSAKKEWLSRVLDTVYVNIPKNKEIDYTLFDPGSVIIKTVDFKKSFEELSAQALKAKHFIDRYDAITALRDTALEVKRDLLIRVFRKRNFHTLQSEIISQLSKDTSTVVYDIMRFALRDKDFLVRRAVVDNYDTIPVALLSDTELLLQDTSYYTIENTLRKLYKSNPDKTARGSYLNATSYVYGINNNVRIAWLEINYNHSEDSIIKKNFATQIVEYTSNRYEFRTRVRAFETLERINYCDETLIANIFNAATYTNSRLGGPAKQCLKSLLKKSEYKQMANSVFAAGKWKDWERKILEGIDGINPQ